MKKKTKALLFLAALVVIISCALVGGDKETKKQLESQKNSGNNGKVGVNEAKTVQPESPLKSPEKKEEPVENAEPVKTAYPLMSSYNKKELDDEIVEKAKASNKDPKKVRVLLREEADKTRIYRELGMFVIKNPSGEEVYLPDQL